LLASPQRKGSKKMEQALPLMNHVSIGTNNLESSLAYYDELLDSIGAKRIIDVPGIGAAYGRVYPEFWVQKPYNEEPAETANGVHFAFFVESKEQVNRFYQTAMALGSKDDGEPGPRAEYSDAYYGCFVRDLEGHKIEAMIWDESKLTSA
jgi:catechol 2,3-dioxygenase-like lactoylglutathione lyase family enzyme